MHRRRFLAAAAVGVPTVLAADIGSVLASENGPGTRDGGKPTASRSGRGLGIQRVIWSGADDGVALTFDDGPDPDLTPRVLEVLAARRIRATFMLIGKRAEERPDLVERLFAEGHEIGNHTWSHPSLATIEVAAVRTELQRTHDLLSAHAPVRFFRPPRGILTGAAAQVAATLGYDILLWSAVFASNRYEPGTVVCLHDGIGRSPGLRARRRQEIDALPGLLDAAIADGARFVTASELSGDP